MENNDIEKKEKQKEIIWKIIPIALYFIFLCCLLFSSVSMPIFILIVLIVVGIMVALNIFCWKKYGKSADNELTIDRIMDCIRIEGFYPEKQSDECVTVKIQGISYEILYVQSLKLSIRLIFEINHYDIQLLKDLSRNVLENMFLGKVDFFSDKDGSYIKFSIDSWIKSYSDFKEFFPHYISSLNEINGRVHDLFQEKKSELQQQSQSEQPETYFMRNTSNNIKS